MELNITPEDIDKYVKDALLECTIGKNVKEAVEKSIKELFSRNYNNPVEEFVKQHLKDITREYMNQDHIKPLIIQSVAKSITPESIEKIVTFGLKELQTQMERYRD